MQGMPEVGVLPHAVAVAADRHDVAVVDEPIDEGRGHHVIAKDLAPLFKALVGRQDRRRLLIATERSSQRVWRGRRSTNQPRSR